MGSQSIRPSQFVSTYGPGSILEGPDGPRIVLSLEKSEVYGHGSPASYTILESSLSAVLKDYGSPVPVRLPTNAELHVKDSSYLYKTQAFPCWSLCVKHSILYRRTGEGPRSGCPRCPEERDSYSAYRTWRREAIRFVAACDAGHLDDVNWYMVVKHANPQCSGGSYAWEGGGGSLRDVTLRCLTCKGTGNLGLAYAKSWPCSGNWPEHKRREQGCSRPARIFQRGAANLYSAELVTAVTVPKLDSRLHQTLGHIAIRASLSTLQSLGALNGSNIRKQVGGLTQSDGIPAGLDSELDNYSDDAIERAALEILDTILPTTEVSARIHEYRQLQKAATHGHPIQLGTVPGGPPLFEVVGSAVRPTVAGPLNVPLRVTPVSRLRVVMAQVGYRRRLSSTPGELVESTWTDGANRWIPGVELHGEGIFVDLSPSDGKESALEHPEPDGPDARKWREAYAKEGAYQYHPVFVWWHTLSHRLIRALGIDSGYSSAAVRERVYFSLDATTGKAVGGVLLYTAQPGGDGTLGGLIALVPSFERTLQTAMLDLSACSNDPLCLDERFTPGRANGAACYACGFVSETSCECRNMFLDRNLLIGSLP